MWCEQVTRATHGARASVASARASPKRLTRGTKATEFRHATRRDSRLEIQDSLVGKTGFGEYGKTGRRDNGMSLVGFGSLMEGRPMTQTLQESEPHTMKCLEVWGGNQAVDNGVVMAGLYYWFR